MLHVGSLHSYTVMVFLGIQVFDILDLICRSILVGARHLENPFHKRFFLKRLDINSRTCSKFANFDELNRP
jgi:hypothetical protein